MVHVTAFFASILAFVYIGLAAIIIKHRYAARLIMGDGGDPLMTRKIRAHANFNEYVPLALVLMAVDELNGMSKTTLTICGIALVVGRLSHSYSLIVAEVKSQKYPYFRSFGMILTFGVVITLAVGAIF